MKNKKAPLKAQPEFTISPSMSTSKKNSKINSPNRGILSSNRLKKPIKSYPTLVNDKDMLEFARSLVYEQRVPFDLIIGFCKGLKQSVRSNIYKQAETPPLLIVHGEQEVEKFE